MSRALPYGPRTVRARLRVVGQAPRASLILVEVGVRHVERHSRLRSPDELAALHALLKVAGLVVMREVVGVAGRGRRRSRFAVPLGGGSLTSPPTPGGDGGARKNELSLG